LQENIYVDDETAVCLLADAVWISGVTSAV